MTCGKTRDLEDIPELLSMPKSSNVFGTNEKKIGTLADLAAKSVTLSSTLDKAGIKSDNGLFWSGCSSDGKYVASLSCDDWSTKTGTLKANCGSTTKTSSSDLKVAATSTCKTPNQVVCLCPRRT